MKNNESIKRFTGTVITNLGGGLYRIRLANDKEITARVSGKMRKYSIQILVNDKVEVEMSIYDQTKGRVVTRL